MEEFKHIIDERAVDGAIASSELDNQMPREAIGAAELTATKKTPHVEHQNAETQGKYTKRSRIDRTHAARTDSSVATVMVGRSRRQREADSQMRPASTDEKSVINPRQPTHARKRTSHANRWDTSSMDSSSTSCSQTSSVPNNASSTDEPTESSMSEGGYEGSKSGSGSSCDDRRNSHVHHTVQWSRDEKHTKATSPSRKGLSLFEDGESPVSSSSNAGPDGPGNDGLELSIQDPLPGGNRKAAFAQSSASKDQSRGDRASSTGEKSETSSSGIFSVLNPRTNLKEGRRIDFKARADCDAITNLKRTGGSYQSAVNFSSDTQINSYETRNLIDVSSGASLAGASVSTSFLGGGAAKSSENETATKTSNASSERSFSARKEDIADTNSAIGNGSNGSKSKSSSKQKVALHQEEGELRPAPYFYYVDRSREEDDDPLTPLTPPARVPIFPAK